MFEVLSFKIRVGQYPNDVIETEAILKVDVDGKTKNVVGEGNDVKDAFYQALSKALLSTYPCLEKLKIVSYEVFVPKDNSFVAAVLIFSNGEERWGEIESSVNLNVCEAILRALVKGLRTMIKKTG